MNYIFIKKISGLIDDLNTTNEEVILDTLDSIYETFYQRAYMDENDYILSMNKLIEILLKEKNKTIIDSILDALLAGIYYKDSKNVNFEPLIDFTKNCNDDTTLDYLINLFGASSQPKYIDFLKSISVDNHFLQKEIQEAINELEHVK